MSRIAETLTPSSYHADYVRVAAPLARNPRLIPEGVPLDVAMSFKRLADEVARAGFIRYSSDAILHRLRWQEHIERGNREFKINNDWSSQLARWYMANNPERKGFFETRKLKEERDAEG